MPGSTNRVEGIGFQLNLYTTQMLPELARIGATFDYVELLCDAISGPLDSSHLIDPRSQRWFDDLRSKYDILAHSNYGEEFGFTKLEDTPSVKRHIPLSNAIGSPWLADHMFYGVPSSGYLWSTPIQFSKNEIERVAGRAAALQDILKAPLLHENAFIYAVFPGSAIHEAEFLAEIVEKAGTHLLLDLHNLYANSVNFKGYDPANYLRTVPLDKVIEVHIAGGQWIDGWYHDLHNHSVPEPVWELLEHVMKNGKNLKAVTLEVQGTHHTARSRPIDDTWPEMVKKDLDRAKALWGATHANRV